MTTTMTAPPPTGAVFSTFEVRDMDQKAGFTRLAGRAVPYNTPANVGGFTEEFVPGAFARSIEQGARALPLLLFHNDRGWPIGAAESWQDTRDGLDGVWKLDQHEDAQRAAQMANDGMLSYMSIRFMQDPGRFTFDNTRSLPHFRRESARLVETSLTPTPVYIDSTVSWVRSLPAGQTSPAVAEWSQYLEQIKRGPVSA
ncbi:MAG TPA: HK97 family phage prohead protease [Kribbella sp.]|nr:HK97 family phage prohead protease [Kribbella sp.]